MNRIAAGLDSTYDLETGKWCFETQPYQGTCMTS